LSRAIFKRDLQHNDNANGLPPWLVDDEFLQKYRMHWASFKQLVELIKDHPIFHIDSNKDQAKPEHQLLLFLYYLGKSGSGASNSDLRNIFQIGRGTADCYKRRCVKAIRWLRDNVIKWPDNAERHEISKRILHKYTWINCVGVVDGTLFPLTYAPQSDDAPDYHGRKFLYSLSTIIVNDDEKRIRYYLAGYPGSTHDNRIYRNTRLYNNLLEYFGENGYLLGDCAFENTRGMVTSFKKLGGQQLDPNQEGFNTHVGKLRITSEHTIGMLKARFQFLRSIPMLLIISCLPFAVY
jgi:DDE superfamily endonuclease